MKKYPSFKIDLYGVTINVVCCKDWRKKANSILEKNDYEEENLTNADGFSMKMEVKDGIYVFFSPSISDSTVYHECIHLLVYVMNNCRLKADVYNSESIAYLGEYIINHVMRIKKQAIKKPRGRTIKKSSKRGKK